MASLKWVRRPLSESPAFKTRKRSTSRLDRKSDELDDHRNAGVISIPGGRAKQTRQFRKPRRLEVKHVHDKPSDVQWVWNTRRERSGVDVHDSLISITIDVKCPQNSWVIGTGKYPRVNWNHLIVQGSNVDHLCLSSDDQR